MYSLCRVKYFILDFDSANQKKREHFDLMLGFSFQLPKLGLFFPVFIFNYCYFHKTFMQKQSINLSFVTIIFYLRLDHVKVK